MTTETSVAPLPQAPRTGPSRALTWAIAAVFAVLVAIALVVALAAALVVGAVVAVAALVLRLAPRRRADDAPKTLEGRRTPDGWVVEAALRR
jgi:Flp pilus assembly protein TadB